MKNIEQMEISITEQLEKGNEILLTSPDRKQDLESSFEQA